MKELTVLLCLGLVASLHASLVLKPLSLSMLDPTGLSMSTPDQPGVSLFAVHYSINKPCTGTSACTYNYDVTRKTGDVWLHENRKVNLKQGDVVYYWYLLVVNGMGHQLTDMKWVATATTATTTTGSTTRSTANTTPGQTSGTTPGQTSGTTPSSTTAGSASSTQLPTSTPPSKEDECTSYPCMIFEDNFDKLDFRTWQHEITAGGGGNWEFQYYTNNRSNSYVRDGVLYLKPTLTTDKYGDDFLSSGVLDIYGAAPPNLCTGAQYYGCFRVGSANNYINPVQSARIRTVESFNFRYGRVEVEAQLPRGDWIWPAIWLLPEHEEYGGWPASGEIDIMESRGNENYRDPSGGSQGNDHFGATLHYGPWFPINGYPKASEAAYGDFADRFHTYTLDWDDSSIRISIDGQTVLDVVPGAGGMWEYGDLSSDVPEKFNPWAAEKERIAPFNREFYLIMNVAVGGTNGFFPDSFTNSPYPKPWSNESPTAPKDFWEARDLWYPTWNPDVNNGESAAMKVRSVKVWKIKP